MLTKAANQFAVDLFHCYLRRHGDKYRNLLLCPYLIYHSLAMMLVGAKGQTAEQLARLLRIPPITSSKQQSSSSRNRSASSNLDSNQASGNGAKRDSSSSSSSPSSSRSASLSGAKSLATGVCKDFDTLKLRQQQNNMNRSPSSASSIASSTDSSLSSPVAVGKRRSRSQSRSSRRSGSASRSAGSSRRSSPKSAKSLRVKDGSQIQAEKSLAAARQLIAMTPDPDEARHREFLWLTEQLIHGNHDFVHLASFIYLDKSTKRTERYKAILRDYYETKPKKVEFENVDNLVKTINEDVARTTENIYSDILSKQEAQKLEKSYMLLVNAVFFRGFWLSNFTDVKQAPFIKYPPRNSNNNNNSNKDPQVAAASNKEQVADGKENPKQPINYNVNMMSKLDYLPVVSDEQLDARIIRMPFEASDLQMLLILPNDKQSDSTYLCEQISAIKINQVLDQFYKSKCKTVRITMPIFCIDSGKISIQSTLVTMGASDLFDQNKADMSGVCENKPVWLHKILHRCFIVCDNRGAITSSGFEKAKKRQAQLESGISSGRSGVEEFKADHPFMYIIFDSVTKTILMIGLYTDPSETLEVIHENQLSPEEAHQIYTEGVYKT